MYGIHPNQVIIRMIFLPLEELWGYFRGSRIFVRLLHIYIAGTTIKPQNHLWWFTEPLLQGRYWDWPRKKLLGGDWGLPGIDWLNIEHDVTRSTSLVDTASPLILYWKLCIEAHVSWTDGPNEGRNLKKKQATHCSLGNVSERPGMRERRVAVYSHYGVKEKEMDSEGHRDNEGEEFVSFSVSGRCHRWKHHFPGSSDTLCQLAAMEKDSRQTSAVSLKHTHTHTHREVNNFTN